MSFLKSPNYVGIQVSIKIHDIVDFLKDFFLYKNFTNPAKKEDLWAFEITVRRTKFSLI